MLFCRRVIATTGIAQVRGHAPYPHARVRTIQGNLYPMQPEWSASSSRLFVLRGSRKTELFDAIFDAALATCASLRLVLRGSPSTDTCVDALDALHPFLLTREEVNKWPGTGLGPGVTASMFTYVLEPAVVDIMCAGNRQVFDWVQPALPQDPHLLRADGTVWFYSTTYDEIAGFYLTDTEWNDLQERFPLLANSIRLWRYS